MPRPKRPSVLPDRPRRGGSYVSPYRMGGSNNASPAGSRNLSNNSQKNRFGYRNSPGYTPPGRKASPAGSANSRGSGNRF